MTSSSPTPVSPLERQAGCSHHHRAHRLDWAELDAFATAGYDPLFGSSIEKHYLDLHARIMQIRQAETYSGSRALEGCEGKS